MNTLPFGIYLGEDEIRRDVPGFSISLLTPTLHAEDVPLHTHTQASFIFVLSGRYCSSADGAPPVSDAPILIFNPVGTTHRDSFLTPERGRFLAVSLSSATDGPQQPVSSARVCNGPAALDTAIRLAQATTAESPDTLEDLCWTLLADVYPPEQTSRRDHHVPSWAAGARQMIRDLATTQFELRDVARQLGLHPVYFTRAFRAAFHCTPAQYRNHCRLRHAMHLLRHAPSVPLSDIALQCGFCDQSHFTVAFGKHYGRVPGLYRSSLHTRLAASSRRQSKS